MKASCCLISENEYVKFNWIIVQFANELIFWNNSILQKCNLWNNKLKNSIYQYFTIVRVFPY